jgi:hypothetical protein
VLSIFPVKFPWPNNITGMKRKPNIVDLTTKRKFKVFVNIDKNG